MKYWAIMIALFTDGTEARVAFETYHDCGEALMAAPGAAARMGKELDMAQCVETDVPSGSIRPRHRPEAI